MPNASVDPQQALRRLVDGNHRFVNEVTSMRARVSASREWRARLAEGQTPFATIVSCSDSRVPAEIVFDQGLGDLFIVRNAGNAIGPVSLASIEFAVAKLGTRLVVVLAHESCGAFRAACDVAEGAAAPSESLRELLDRLLPALAAAGPEGSREERCELAAQIYARQVAEMIARSPLVEPLLRSGALSVVPAYYRLTEGTVAFAGPVPPPSAKKAPCSEEAELAHEAA